MPENESELNEEQLENETNTEEIAEEITEEIAEETVEELSAMEKEIAGAKAEFEANKTAVKEEPFNFPQAFKADEPKTDPSKNIERLLDVEMNVTVRFGLTEMPLREVVKFGIGTMIELNRTIDEPVELLVNNYPFARGEVVVIDGYYGVRVTDIGTPEERSRTLLSNSN